MPPLLFPRQPLKRTDETVYLVADDFGRLGRAWRETDYEATDLETVIQDLPDRPV
jgi:hypothetical protein